ncbi:MAG TPA: ABC transporter substrate-binding protein, partial [Syntrophomonadaceae bacterium]|nr:ABC transporter substrate-binding protein [Syntrophomonadaceae bacterium]
PLVVVVRKGQLAKVRKIINYVYSREIQEFLLQQSFIPALAQLAWPSILLENNNKIIWKGWNNFLSNLKN